ncbi:hypothetical protein ACFWD7_39385 [Streptomyces mirabilis]
MANERIQDHAVERQYTVRRHGVNPGGNCRQVQPDVATEPPA